MTRRARLGVVVALAGAATVVGGARVAFAQAQTATMVVQLPFTGAATDELMQTVEDAARAALLARSAAGPDRATVRGAVGVSAPSDTAGITGFGRSMGGTHVLTGQVTPLTGQFNLTLRLYEVASGRMAEQTRNIGEGEEGTAVAQMVAALFAPGALGVAPEVTQAQDAERQRAEAERRRQEAQRQREEQRRRDDEARRRREAEERGRRVYLYGEGGRGSAGAALVLGGRITSVQPRDGQPPAEDLAWGLRFEGGYALLPAIGLEVGGAFMVVGSPTQAVMLGPTARIAWPTRGHLPLRGSAGVVAGLFQGVSGARVTSAWLGLDVRAEYDVIPAVTLFAGLTLDGAPGSYASLGGILGARVRFGDARRPDAPAPSAPAPESGTPTTTP